MSFYNSKKVRLLQLLYIVYFLTAAIITLGLPISSFSLYQLGQICGVLALSGLVLQLWMGARVKLLERGVGLDNILRYHSLNARLTLTFIVLHPTLMFGPFLLSRTMTLPDIISSFGLYHYLGIAAFLLIILTITVTVYQSKLRINYEHWKVIHKVGYIIIILGFVHSFFVGSDIIARRPLFYWWVILAFFAISAFFYRYVVRSWLLRKSMYQIVKIAKETSDIRSIYFKPLNSGIFPYVPGQFAFVRFYSKRLSSEEHHFTISSSPLHNPISFTVKESGDFTSQLDKLRVGDTARIEGPFGAFSNAGMTGPFVFIAGGIGITPLMSMVRFMKDTNQKEKTLLIYSAKTKKDLAFYNALEKLKKQARWLKVIYVLSQESHSNEKHGWYHGRITAHLLQKQVSNVLSSQFFIVGPVPMMDEVTKLLVQLGVNKRKIFTERFALK